MDAKGFLLSGGPYAQRVLMEAQHSREGSIMHRRIKPNWRDPFPSLHLSPFNQ